MSALRVLPWALHVALAYLAGIFLVVAPFALGFTDSVALPVLLGAGVIVLVTAMLGRGSLGVFGILPGWGQAVLDYLIAFALMGAPFAFSFRDETDALLVSVMTGLGLLVMSLLSRYPQAIPTPAPSTLPPPATTGTLESTGTHEGAAHQPEPEPDLPDWVQADEDHDNHEADDEASADHPH